MLLVLISIVLAGGQQTTCPPTVRSIQPLLDRAFMAGAAIVVVDRNGVVYEQGFGFDTPLFPSQRRLIDTSDSVFLLASISKTFIAVATMQMVEAKRLDLDVNINQYLSPALTVAHPQYANVPITMRHLLMHSSGIGINGVVEMESYSLGDAFTKISLLEVMKQFFIGNEGWLPIPPGNRTFYSNAGTNLAALVIERLAGIRFDQYVQERILKPLGITEKMGGYRLGQFNPTHLVPNFLYNESLSPQLDVALKHFNTSQVNAEVAFQ